MSRKWLLRFARLTYLAALGAVFLLVVVQRRTEIADLIHGARLAMLASSLILSFGMLAIASLFWRAALGLLGGPVRYSDVLVATSRSVFARYIPGSVWYALSRSALLRRGGIPTVHLATTAALEIVMSLATALALGASLLGLHGEMPGGLAWVVPAALVFIALASPPVVRGIIRWLPGHEPDQLTMGWSGYGSLLGIMVLFWLWSAGVFALYLRAFPANDAFGVQIVIGGFLLSWGVGFLAFVAPQGAGVFELTLASLLVAQGVAEVAVVIAGYRLVILLRDAIASMLSEAYVSRRERVASAAR